MTVNTKPIVTVLLSAAGLMALAAILGGCAGGASNRLNNTHWKLTGMDQRLIPPDVAITLDFTAGRLSGSGGCNSYGGGYKLEGDQITITEPIVSTLMACPGDDRMTWEAQYLAALGDNPRAEFPPDGALILTSRGGTVLIFTRR